MDLLKRRELALQRYKQMETTRSKGWEPHWRSIVKNLLPRSSRFLTEDRDKGGEMNASIIDSSGTRALRVLAAGMMAGMTSPARPWFRVSLSDEDLADQHAVKVWLDDTTKLLLRIFRKSNTYNTLHDMYRELGGFGTGMAFVRPDFGNVIHHNPMTIGSYVLGLNDKGVVDKTGRKFKLTVEQAASWFGLGNLSANARAAYDNSNYKYEIDVVHLVEPNRDRQTGAQGPRGMSFRSHYWDEKDSSSQNRGLLSEGGFRRFPAIAPRWDVLWGDTYGSSPGMDALGDLRALQWEQTRKAKAIDYQTDPPLQVPLALRSQGADLLPGGVSYYDALNPNGGIRTAFEVNLDTNLLLQDIQDVRNRIDGAFYVDMFLMLSQMDNTRMTATEVAERHEEKLLMLGPVLERLHNEMLEPLVSYTFERCLETGILPPVPEELNGVEINIEFISTLAQAQKAVAVNSTDRLLGHIGMIIQATGDTSPMDKFNTDLSIERYADQLGVDPDLIVSGEQVALVRQQRAQAAQAAQQAEMAEKMASAAQKMGGVSTGPMPQDNAANDILNLFSGYQTPAATEL